MLQTCEVLTVNIKRLSNQLFKEKQLNCLAKQSTQTDVFQQQLTILFLDCHGYQGQHHMLSTYFFCNFFIVEASGNKLSCVCTHTVLLFHIFVSSVFIYSRLIEDLVML